MKMKKTYDGGSLSMEMAGRLFFGDKDKIRGKATAFMVPSYFQKQAPRFTKRTRKRIREIITIDDRLLELLEVDLDGLERDIRDVTKRN